MAAENGTTALMIGKFSVQLFMILKLNRLATEYGLMVNVELVIKHKPDVNAKLGNGYTALMIGLVVLK